VTYIYHKLSLAPLLGNSVFIEIAFRVVSFTHEHKMETLNTTACFHVLSNTAKNIKTVAITNFFFVF